MASKPDRPLTRRGGSGRVSPAADPGRAVADFLSKASKIKPASSGQGRLIFALDATMSRQPTWDHACRLQAEMFNAAARTGSLAVQLVYFRGFGECRASKWVVDTRALRDLMTGIQCRGGQTQIGKVLSHIRKESGDAGKVSAVVFVGDAMEEPIDALAHQAGQLGLLGVPVFMFQEGHDPVAEQGFREIARLTNGAYMRFDEGAASQLASLLNAVARFASGGRAALTDSGTATDRKLLEQLR